MHCRKLLLRYHTIKGGIEFLLRYHPLHDDSQNVSDVLKLTVLVLSYCIHKSQYTLLHLLQAKRTCYNFLYALHLLRIVLVRRDGLNHECRHS
jgi:hypothetical protein